MKKRNIIALSVLVVVYVAFGITLTLLQKKIVYHPNTQDFQTCPNFSEAEKVTFKSTRMYVYDMGKPLVVLYHGNAGSACDRKFYADLFSAAGYGYIIVEYTGFSNDARTPTHDAIKADVKNVVDYLAEYHKTDVTVAGESIGTAIASYHVSLAAPDKLLLISPMSNLVDVAHYRFWFYPTSILVDNAFDSVNLLSNYRGPVTIIHGDHDGTIPYSLGKKLFDSLQTEKLFVTIVGGDHNNLFDFGDMYTAMQTFLSPKTK